MTENDPLLPVMRKGSRHSRTSLTAQKRTLPRLCPVRVASYGQYRDSAECLRPSRLGDCDVKVGTVASYAQAIAKDAYIYGFPFVDSYGILYSYFVERSCPEYKAGWIERVANNPRVYTPDG